MRLDTAIQLAAALGVPLSDMIEGIAWAPGYSLRGHFEAALGAGTGASDG